MMTLFWRWSANLHGLLQRAPSNVLIARIRTGRKSAACSEAALAAGIYLALAAVCAAVGQSEGRTWLNGLSGVLIWDGFKLAWWALPAGKARPRDQHT